MSCCDSSQWRSMVGLISLYVPAGMVLCNALLAKLVARSDPLRSCDRANQKQFLCLEQFGGCADRGLANGLISKLQETKAECCRGTLPIAPAEPLTAS